MADPGVAVDLHLALDVLGHVAAQVTLDLEVLVDEVAHLRGHRTVARAAAEDDRIVVLELERIGDRRLLVHLVPGGLGHVFRHQLGHALDVDLRTGFARAIGDYNPVYHDAEAARKTEVGGIIAPPSFAQAVAQLITGSVQRLILSRPAVEAGEKASFYRPITTCK